MILCCINERNAIDHLIIISIVQRLRPDCTYSSLQDISNSRNAFPRSLSESAIQMNRIGYPRVLDSKVCTKRSLSLQLCKIMLELEDLRGLCDTTHRIDCCLITNLIESIHGSSKRFPKESVLYDAEFYHVTSG